MFSLRVGWNQTQIINWVNILNKPQFANKLSYQLKSWYVNVVQNLFVLPPDCQRRPLIKKKKLRTYYLLTEYFLITVQCPFIWIQFDAAIKL